MEDLEDYCCGGARALVLLHEQHMRRFLVVWKKAKAAGLALPKTTNEAYGSLETLLAHVLWAAGYYLKWTCQQLEVPAPEISKVPAIEILSLAADEHLELLLREWRLPLVMVPAEAFEAPEHAVSWGGHYSLETMLEHAVMHPIRHAFQLEVLVAESGNDW